MHKEKFRPKVSKIMLNPEQAVLACECYFMGARTRTPVHIWSVTACQDFQRYTVQQCNIFGRSISS